MRDIWFWILILVTAIACLFQLFGLLNIYPIFLTSLVLFVCLFSLLLYLNHRKRFKGF